MKKHILFLFVLALFITLLSFNVNSASADVDVPGCQAGDNFSRTTGQICSKDIIDCKAGDSFSAFTGKSCTVWTDNSSSVSQFNNLFKSNFRVGKRGEDVKALQQFLKDEGYYFGKVDGKYGRVTARAVKDFQEDNDIANTTTPQLSWANPEKVEIIGYDGDSIEPAISKDGQYLFFNNSYQKPKDTTIFYAKKIDGNKFQFLGEVGGIKKEGYYSMTAGIDKNNNLYFSSDRADGKTPNIYRGIFEEGKISQISILTGTINQKRSWDPDISDERAVYYTEDENPLDDFDISISTGENYLLQNINTDKMEYAPSLSQNQLELFFTKADAKSILGILSGKKAKIYMATRKSVSEPFEQPKIIEAIAKQYDDAFVEAPTITADGKTLYYHKKDDEKFAIYRVTRNDIATTPTPPIIVPTPIPFVTVLSPTSN